LSLLRAVHLLYSSLTLDSVDHLDLVGGLQAAIFDIDGKVGAEQGAQTAVDAVGIVGEFRGVVAFGVGAHRHDEHALGAELDTKAASFAPLLDDVDDTVGYLDAVSI
jgi:hypothetical protein